MSTRKERVDMSGGRTLAVDNPFAALTAAGLPAAPAPPAAVVKPAAAPRRRETLLLRRLTGGKGGKVVTEISGFAPGHGWSELPALLKRLQARLGTGGTVKDGCIELQGEWRAALQPLLEAEGFRVKGGVQA